MKTQILYLGLFFIFISGFTIKIYTQPVEPVNTMEVPAITELPVLDGLLNEEHWSSEQSTYLFPWEYGSNFEWDGELDLSCTFHVAWGMSHLYLFIEIADDIEHSWNGKDGNQWEFDNIEVYFQLDTNTISSGYDSTSIAIRFCRGKTGWSAWNGRAEESEFGAFYESLDSSWLVETAIPWTCALPLGSEPDDILEYLPVIGFDLLVTDSDNTAGNELIGSAESEVSWDPDDLGPPSDIPEWPDLWNNTAIFGYLTLSGEPINALAKNHRNSSFGIYPNPAKNMICFKNITKVQALKIYNLQGTLVQSSVYYPGQALDISRLQSGMYIAVSQHGNQERFVKK